MATRVQTIAKNIKAINAFTSIPYKTEQRGAWSLDITINNRLTNNIKCTLWVSNDNVNYYKYIILNESVDSACGASFAYNEMPYDYIKIEMTGGGAGDYNILYNERWQG